MSALEIVAVIGLIGYIIFRQVRGEALRGRRAVLLATGLHAHVATSSATLLLSLGINRLAQAAVIVPRVMAMGVPFAPEKNGKVFMGETFNRGRS